MAAVRDPNSAGSVPVASCRDLINRTRNDFVSSSIQISRDRDLVELLRRRGLIRNRCILGERMISEGQKQTARECVQNGQTDLANG
jgi:hypothetical protein